MKNYLDLMSRILSEGDIKEPARQNMPRTKELFTETLTFDLQKGFPLLTTKKMYIKGIVEELLWFLRGSTNVSELIKKGVNIWNEDGYRYYTKNMKNMGASELTFDEWVSHCLSDSLGEKGESEQLSYHLGDIYGHHWRNWGGTSTSDTNLIPNGVDQILNLVNMIIKSPNSRYQIVTAWNPTVNQSGTCALPSCHILFQTNIRNNKYLDLTIFQRSCDYFLGVPFNIASYALLTEILSKLTGYKPGVLKWIGGSCHIYENQVNSVLEQVVREPKNLPKITINNLLVDDVVENELKNEKGYSVESLNKIFKSLSFDDFVLSNYNPHPTIKAPLSTGLNLNTYKLVW